MICVECAVPVSSLYTYYSDDNIHATRCANCGQFADKYIESDRMLVLIDLILLRPPAIRHITFNATAMGTLSSSKSRSPSLATSEAERSPTPQVTLVQNGNRREFTAKPPSAKEIMGISRLGFRLIIMSTLFDVYLQWAMSEKSQDPRIVHFLESTSALKQYTLFLILCAAETFAVHFVLRKSAWYVSGWRDGGAVSTAVIIGSFIKLLPILTLIWHFDIPFAEQLVRYASPVCMIEVLNIIIGLGYLKATMLTAIGLIACSLLSEVFWYMVS